MSAWWRPVVVGVVLLGVAASDAVPPPGPAATAVEPKADELLKRMGALLAGAKSFTFSSYSTVDQTLDSGQAVQVARRQRVSVRRPDGVAAAVEGDTEDLNFWYDGKRVTVLNVRTASYAQTEAPASIDATFDLLAEKFALVIPLADLVFADPYKTLIAGARSGQHVGTGYVFDAKCDHLVFRQAGVDWQLWIEQGERPVPRKLVITYKEAASRPQYTAYLSDWNLDAKVKDDAFAPKIPEGAKRVEFGPAPAGAAVEKP